VYNAVSFFIGELHERIKAKAEAKAEAEAEAKADDFIGYRLSVKI
jgi:hypothetical protein